MLYVVAQAGKAALVAEESAVSAANLARAARTQAALGAAMLAAQAYNQVWPFSLLFIWLGSFQIPRSDHASTIPWAALRALSWPVCNSLWLRS